MITEWKKNSSEQNKQKRQVQVFFMKSPLILCMSVESLGLFNTGMRRGVRGREMWEHSDLWESHLIQLECRTDFYIVSAFLFSIMFIIFIIILIVILSVQRPMSSVL